MIAKTPEAPYFAVIFTSLKVSGASGYDEMALKMDELAKQQPGYLGVESVRGADGMGLTISYWKDLESISSWKRNSEHLRAPRRRRRHDRGDAAPDADVHRAGRGNGRERRKRAVRLRYRRVSPQILNHGLVRPRPGPKARGLM